MTESVMFYLFGLVAIISAISVVVQRSPIASALSLVVCFFALAAEYVLLEAHFVAVIQVLVYAGAIMVLFIFVIMLLNIRESGPTAIGVLSNRGIAGLFASGILGIGAIAALDGWVNAAPAELPAEYGTIAAMGRILFSGPYLLPFEAVSLLLTVGMVGAVVLAKREL